ncbi:MAG: hypothetical protein ACREX8_04685 [Gammaproteobacteria bacterium]
MQQARPVCDPCACHNGPHRPCTVPGGCGHLHKPEHVKTGALIVAATGLCLTCTRIVTDAITQLPRDYVDLHLALSHNTTGLHELVTGSTDPPAALRVNVAALAAELATTATMWAEPVAEKLGISWDSGRMGRHTRPGNALQRATRILVGAIPVLLALRDVEVQTWADNGWYRTYDPADGIDGALTLHGLHQITRATLGHTKLVHQLPAPCPHCDTMSLVRDDGDDHVHCQRCHLRWPEADYRRLTLILTSGHQATTR